MNKINLLRELLKKQELYGYIIPGNDEYLSEYTPNCAKRLEYLTRFSGSNGLAIICLDRALFFTDGRYLEQSKRQLDINIFQIFDLKELPEFPWLDKQKTIGYDPKLFTRPALRLYKNLQLLAVTENLVDQIWEDKPAKPDTPIYEYEIKYAGIDYKEKVANCRQILDKNNAEAFVITALDSIAWLLNIRASDIEFTPLLLGSLILTADKIYLFVEPDRIDKELATRRSDVTVLPETSMPKVIGGIKGKILIDENLTSAFIMDLIPKNQMQVATDPCQLPKACKNPTEIQYAIEGHIKDAVSVCEFLAYIAATDLSNLTEYDLGLHLTKIRRQQENYISDSFPVICGFQENSAVIHYRAAAQTAKKIVGSGILLIDSGAQYLGATTDITRTTVIGSPSPLQKKRYTQVLKGHIALANTVFSVGTVGANLDVLARQFLWRDFLDYAHGTGHGVGSFLSVHEGPQAINQRNNVSLKPGMILSNEPGFYLPGEYGIRIENLVYVKLAADPKYLEFTQLTLVPYEAALIDRQMLTAEETDYIRKYYTGIKADIYPLLSAAGKKWLSEQLALFL